MYITGRRTQFFNIFSLGTVFINIPHFIENCKSNLRKIMEVGTHIFIPPIKCMGPKCIKI